MRPMPSMYRPVARFWMRTLLPSVDHRPLLVGAVGVAVLADRGAVGRAAHAVEVQAGGAVLDPHVAAVVHDRPLLVGVAAVAGGLPGVGAVGGAARAVDAQAGRGVADLHVGRAAAAATSPMPQAYCSRASPRRSPATA